MPISPPDPSKQRRKKPGFGSSGTESRSMSSVLHDPTGQRRFPRYSLDVRVSAKVFRTEAPIELWGRSIEFGQDGIGVTLTGELQPGEVATLELTLPGNSTPLKLRGLVRYRDGLRHGFEFLARDEIQRELIRRTCELLSVGR
jgi:PilZ domain